MPASRMKLGLPDDAPATPMTSDRLLTSPSLTPKMTARSVPERPPARCHDSRLPTSAAFRARPAMATPSRPGSRHEAHLLAGLEPFPDDRVLALVGGDGGRLGRRVLGAVGRLLVALECLDEVGHGRRPEQPGGEDDEPDAHPGPVGRRHVRTEVAQLRGPDVGVTAFVAGDPAEGVGSARVLLDRRQRVVQDDRVAFQLEVVEAPLDVDGGHGSHRRPSSPRRLGSCLDASIPELRYLSASDVMAAMPPLDERLRLAERTLTALVADAELPAKIGDPSPARRARSSMPCRRSCAAPIRMAARTWSG